jgi:hypothetical protein
VILHLTFSGIYNTIKGKNHIIQLSSSDEVNTCFYGPDENISTEEKVFILVQGWLPRKLFP